MFRNGGFFLIAVRIKNGETVEANGKSACFKAVIAGVYVDGNGVIKSGRHLACDKAVPDKFIKFILFGSKAFFKSFGRKFRHGGADSFVSVLCAGFCFISLVGAGKIFFAVGLFNIVCCGLFCFRGNSKRVGSHIGDKTDRAHSGNVDTFVKFLSNSHDSSGLEA